MGKFIHVDHKSGVSVIIYYTTNFIIGLLDDVNDISYGKLQNSRCKVFYIYLLYTKPEKLSHRDTLISLQTQINTRTNNNNNNNNVKHKHTDRLTGKCKMPHSANLLLPANAHNHIWSTTIFRYMGANLQESGANSFSLLQQGPP